MLIRSIHSSFSSRRYFCSSSLSKDPTKLFRLKDPSVIANAIVKMKEAGHVVSRDDITTAVSGLINRHHCRKALMIWDSLVKKNIVELNRENHASRLELIAYGGGLDSEKKYFEGLPEGIKDEIIYSALLSNYVNIAEAGMDGDLIEKVAKGGSPKKFFQLYIRIISLHMSIGKSDRAEEMIKEARKHIEPNVRVSTLWLNACASTKSVEAAADTMFSEMKEAGIEPSCGTRDVLAGLFIKNKLSEKAASALRDMEDLVLASERLAFCSVIRHHAGMGNKDGVLRMWDRTKAKWGEMSDFEHGFVVSALLKVDAYEKALEIFYEWAVVLKGARIPRVRRTTFKLMKKAKARSSRC